MKKKLSVFGVEVQFQVSRLNKKKDNSNKPVKFKGDIKLNFGPGPNWSKPDSSWYSVDIDPKLGDVVVNFQHFEGLPISSNSVSCVYGSHVFEHISIFKTPLVFKEIFRVLKDGGVFRLILPDPEKSINEYVKGNKEFQLFKRRSDRAKKLYEREYTLFECLKEDFLSPNGQHNLLGKNTLAHQNAWDYESIKMDLIRAGFSSEKISKVGFKKSDSDLFAFEGTYPSEANEDYRSLYVEAFK